MIYIVGELVIDLTYLLLFWYISILPLTTCYDLLEFRCLSNYNKPPTLVHFPIFPLDPTDEKFEITNVESHY
jgi:hypothetical protein